MWTKISVIGCLLLTAVVAHTALRIEYVNGLNGTYLPRSPHLEGQTWEIPELTQVMGYVEKQIALRRVDAYAMTNPDKNAPPAEELMGEPYNELEQGFIDRTKRDHALHTELHWWCKNFGSLQIVLAPIALVWAIGNLLIFRKGLIKIASVACALLAAGAIFSMILRGY